MDRLTDAQLTELETKYTPVTVRACETCGAVLVPATGKYGRLIDAVVRCPVAHDAYVAWTKSKRPFRQFPEQDHWRQSWQDVKDGYPPNPGNPAVLAAVTELRALRTVVAWYADPANYDDNGAPRMRKHWLNEDDWYWELDNGQRARAALNGDGVGE